MTSLAALKQRAEDRDAYGVKSNRAWNEYSRALDASRSPFERSVRKWGGRLLIVGGSLFLWAVSLSPFVGLFR